MADPELTQPSSEDFADFISVPLHSYGSEVTADRIAFEALSNEIDRSWGVRDDQAWVGASGAFSFGLTMPGGTELPVAGVTMIGVAPTHRRRGILTAMLRQLHADARERNEPVAVLTASEASIYRRFGYGVAMDVSHVQIAASAVRFDPPIQDPGSFESFDPHVETAPMEAVHDRLSRTRPGWLRMTSGCWAQIASDPDFARDGHTRLRGALHLDASGEPDGYVTWRTEASARTDRLADNKLWIDVLVGSTADVEAALWGFVANIDLVTNVMWQVAPVEPTIRWHLSEPRQLRTLAVTDMVWARILDVPRVLSARTYDASGTITLDVTDRFHPESGGRFRLSAPAVGATGTCEPVRDDAPSDLSLDTADLASIVIGGVAPSRLAANGRVTGTRAAVAAADRLFRVAQRPWWPIEF